MRNFILTILLFTLAACQDETGSHARKRTDKLQGFEDAIPLGEVQQEVIPTEHPSPTPRDEKNFVQQDIDPTETNTSTKTLEELLQEEKKAKDTVPTADSIEEAVHENLTNLPVPVEHKEYRERIRLGSKIIDIVSHEQEIYVASRYELLLINHNGNQPILNPTIYKDQLKEEMPAISKICVTSNAEIWVGFTNGELIVIDKNSITKKNGGPTQKKYRIEVIKEISGRIFIGSKGLYEWDSAFNRFLSNDSQKNEVITDITQFDEEHILFSTRASVYSLHLRDRSTHKVYTSFTGDYPIQSVLTQGKDIHVGGRQGVLVLQNGQTPTSRFGTAYSVLDMIPISDSSYFILDTKNNVHEVNQGSIVDSNISLQQVNTLASAQPNLYFGTAQGVVYEISQTQFAALQKRLPSASPPSFSKTYVNACDAVTELLPGRFYSRQISAPVIDRKRYVFFDGTQVCPASPGFMRYDGYALIFDQNEQLTLFSEEKRKQLSLPHNINKDDISKVYIDSHNTIYLGTKKGLYSTIIEEQDSASWKFYEKEGELSQSVITDILEDKRHNLWVTTRIQERTNEIKEKYEYTPLHIKVPSGDWIHFGSANGISTLGISSIKEHKENLYFSNAHGYFVIYPNSKLSVFTQAQGIKDYIIENITFDSKQRMWLSHGYFQNGVSWIEEDTYYSITKEEGLFSNRILDIAEDDENRIWLMDTGGAVHVSSYEKLKNTSKMSAFYPQRASKTDFIP